jgi:hypothetical protein
VFPGIDPIDVLIAYVGNVPKHALFVVQLHPDHVISFRDVPSHHWKQLLINLISPPLLGRQSSCHASPI